MQKIIKKISLLFITLCLSLVFVSCDNKEKEPTVEPTVDVPTVDVPTENPVTPPVDDNGPYVCEGTLTVSPYKVYNSDDTEFGTYNTMFDAIRDAGKNSSSKNKMYVLDANELKIFQRQSKNDCWCYDGLNFVGSKPRTEALEWGKNRSKCYIVDGQGVGYVMLGTKYYENTNHNQDIPLELTSGAYNYMFTKGGEMESNEWVKPGYGYMECYVRLSEATYTPTMDNGAWNAYIFINGAGGNFHSDLGLIGVVREGKVVWALVRNCNHPDHNVTGDNFQVLSWTPVTTMEYDEEKREYNGADDLYFQCYQTVDGWILNITNLRTKQVFTIDERHKSMFLGSTQYFRFLLAASYCPVVMNVWNGRCGASLRNVVFDGVKIARYNETDTYDESQYEDFYPGSPNMIYGFSQGGDCASMECGIYDADGTYISGNPYKAGDRYLSFSCYYDGGDHYKRPE